MGKNIQEIMRTLDISKEEAQSLIREDYAIDRGERLEWEPTVQEETRMRQLTKPSVERKVKQNQKRVQKVDVDKRTIMCPLIDTYKAFEDFTIVNPERQISFTYGGEQYTFTLTKHRSK